VLQQVLKRPIATRAHTVLNAITHPVVTSTGGVSLPLRFVCLRSFSLNLSLFGLQLLSQALFR